ncbi:hypothetical protein E2C01_084295 [Portunus trituberculatus]|uniref:Uncharacterized protein n=1 Tax=Portunus trituberculatus TaxID=210409 RepID=A0A5B7J4F6_PORTR|nr:hypothetical protein [Portunus trituberculatus]
MVVGMVMVVVDDEQLEGGETGGGRGSVCRCRDYPALLVLHSLLPRLKLSFASPRHALIVPLTSWMLTHHTSHLLHVASHTPHRLHVPLTPLTVSKSPSHLFLTPPCHPNTPEPLHVALTPLTPSMSPLTPLTPLQFFPSPRRSQ